MTTLSFGDDVEEVNDYVFAGLRSATQINLNNVKTIGRSAFENASGLTTLTLNGDLTIGQDAFKGSSLSTLNYNIPDLASFTSGVFSGSAITTVNIGANVKQIASGAFYGCSSLTTVNFIDDCPQLTKIGGSAFYGCSALQSITLPSTVTTLGTSAFSESGLTSYTIPASIKEIPLGCFNGCTALTSVTIPATVEKMAYWAFKDCTGLTEINFNVPNLEYSDNIKKVFYKSGNENTVLNIGESVVSLPEELFDGCYLKTINLPASIKTIAADAFLNTNTTPGNVKPVIYVSSVSYAGDVKGWCDITFGNLASNPLSRADGMIDFSIGGAAVTSLTIPSDVTTLKENTFINTSFTSVDLGGVISVGANCFKGCANLATLTMSNDITTLGADAFDGTNITTLNYNVENAATLTNMPYDPTTLTAVNIGSNVKTIPAGAFAGSQITSIDIPAGVTAIGAGAFSGCTLTGGVTYGGGVADWCAIDFGNAAANPMSCMAEGTANVKKGSADIIPTSLNLTGTAVKPYTFVNSNITSLDLGSVTEIGDESFKGCSSLATIKVGETPATLGTDAFSGIPSGHVVNVPLFAYTTYTATAWDALNLKPLSGTIDLVDDGETPYEIDQTVENCEISYTRTFKNDKWQALFLPFAMIYDDWKGEGEVAELVSVDEDGTLVWEVIEDKEVPVNPNAPNSETQIVKGSIEAGHPYIFKPKAFDGVTEREETFTVSGTLVSNETTCTVTPATGYVLGGTYMEKKDMATSKAYALSGGNFYYTTSNEKTLKPYRIFLAVPSSLPLGAPVRSRINGEDVTAIDDIVIDGIFTNGNAYNLQGVRVDDSYKGIVIVNGKKVLRK